MPPCLDMLMRTLEMNREINLLNNVNSKFFFFALFQLKPVSLLPPLYIITPTYPRAEQIAEITRIGNTLKHVSNLFWLVIEDAKVKTPQLTRQLHRLGIPFVHLIGKFITNTI